MAASRIFRQGVCCRHVFTPGFQDLPLRNKVLYIYVRHKATNSGKQKIRKHQTVSAKSTGMRREDIMKAAAIKVQAKQPEPDPEWMANFNKREPQDDVWLHQFYPPMRHTFEEAVQKHAELAQPDMTDNTNSFVYVECLLDMRTRKKTKFTASIYNIIVLPHYFEDGSSREVMAFCRTPEEQQLAVDEGAVFVGGAELVKKIERGEIHGETFDYVLTTADMLPDISSLRKILRDKFPSKLRGNISTDIQAAVRAQVRGKSYQSAWKTDPVSTLRFCIGKLSMPQEQLTENLHAYIEDIWQFKKDIVDRFMTEGFVTCPHSPERFKLHDDELVPQSVQEAEMEKDESKEEDEAAAAASG